MRGASRFAWALASLAVLAVLGGCSQETEDSGQGTTLNWFVAIQPGGSIQEIAKRCSQESDGRYNIDLELLPTDASQQREQLVRRLGAEDSAIDIIGMDVVWTAEFANAGWLQEFPADTARTVTNGKFPSAVESASFNGELYGAPLNSNTQVLFYRDDLVDRAPRTWQEMIDEAERLGPDRGGTIEVQANFYEGYTVLVTSLIASAGAQILAGPEEVALTEQPTLEALEVLGQLGNSSAAAANIDTSTEDTARLGFEAGSAFMINYPFAYASAEANAPQVFRNTAVAPFPRVVADRPAAPPLGGFNLGVSAFSDNADLAFEATECLTNEQSLLTLTELDGLPPTIEKLYDDPVVRKAYPGFADIISQAIQNSEPRPRTPAYTDLSLAIQRALHPIGEIDPNDPEAAYDRLRDALEDAVLREGLL